MSTKVDFNKFKLFINDFRSKNPTAGKTAMVKHAVENFTPDIATRTAQTYVKRMDDMGLFSVKKGSSKKKKVAHVSGKDMLTTLNQIVANFSKAQEQFNAFMNDPKARAAVGLPMKDNTPTRDPELQKLDVFVRSELNRTIQGYGAWVHPKDDNLVYPVATGECIRDLKHRMKEFLGVTDWAEITIDHAVDAAKWLSLQTNNRYTAFNAMYNTFAQIIESGYKMPESSNTVETAQVN